MTNSQINN